MKYQYLKEREVMRKLLLSILRQAVLDTTSYDCMNRVSAVKFIEGEYCELMCYVAGKEYSMILKVLEK